MLPLGAEILTERVSGDQRGAVRRTLSLGVRTHSGGDVAMALVLNISQTGLLLETVVRLEVGETLHVDIPEAATSLVRIVWTDGLLAGCAFVDPLSTAAISAAQLKAPSESTGTTYRSRTVDEDEATFHRTIVLISALISIVALLIFLAAIAPL
ncbi:MAG: PilZ domain-containing protein [Sphingomonas sp.]|nr:PilZ domain-containing protein [Sphingomonas sp.]